MFLGIGWLHASNVDDWRHGRVDDLEYFLPVHDGRVTELIVCLDSWARARGLVRTEAEYVSATRSRRPLRASGAAVKRALRAHYADLARMEDVLRGSDLDWTAVRPPRLTDKPVTGRCRTAYGQNIRRGVFVSRADVAHYMLSMLDNPETFHQTVGIAQLTRKAKTYGSSSSWSSAVPRSA